ncbi:MAG: hypothetical protein ACJ74Z_06030, partial [Bryobacteraceae bacterium]
MSSAGNIADLASKLPVDLKNSRLFAAWYYHGKHKIPINPRTGCNARTSAAADWATHHEAAEFLRASQERNDKRQM